MDNVTSRNTNKTTASPLLYLFGGTHNGRFIPRTYATTNDVNDISNESISIETFLPGTFIVLQGMESDGMQNTIDILPKLPPLHSSTSSLIVSATGRPSLTHNSLIEATKKSSSAFIPSEVYEAHSSDEEDNASAEDFHHIQAKRSALELLSNSHASSTNSAMLSSLGSCEEDDRIHQFLQHDSHPPMNSNEADQRDEEEDEDTKLPAVPLSNENLTNNVEESFIVIQPGGTRSRESIEFPDTPTSTPFSKNLNFHDFPGLNSIILRSSNENENEEEHLRSRETAIAKSILEWGEKCRARELAQLEEKHNIAKINTNSDVLAARSFSFSLAQAEASFEEAGGRKRRRNWKKWKPKRWWQNNGKLVIFTSLPTPSANNDYENNDAQLQKKWYSNIIGELSPGATVMGTEIITLFGKDLPPEEPMNASTPAQLVQEGNDCKRKYEFLRIESPVEGYILYRRGGYNYLGHGLPANYCNPNEWLWRVTCTDGAYVREGLELDTDQRSTLTYGSLVPVKARSVNEMGLCRLQVDLPHILNGGWVSESLNPLSGQRGPILQQLPFPMPVIYRVILEEGAVIRKDKELSSPEVGRAPHGTLLRVTGRSFSNYPEAQCVERLRLAGNEGWISLRLNLRPPRNEMVVEMVGIDNSFDPNNPGLYHINALAEVDEKYAACRAVDEARIRKLSAEIASSSESESENEREKRAGKQSSIFTRTPSGNKVKDGVLEEHCLICLTEERNSTIIHGGTGHIACCLDCSRILKGRGDSCPVCRLPIEAIIQQFWA